MSKFIVATVGSAVITLFGKLLNDELGKIRSVKSLLEPKNKIQRIVSPGFDWEGHPLINISFFAITGYLSPFNWIVHWWTITPNVLLPLFYDDSVPYSAAFIIQGTANLWIGNWIPAILAFGKVFIVDNLKDASDLINQNVDIITHNAFFALIMNIIPAYYYLLGFVIGFFLSPKSFAFIQTRMVLGMLSAVGFYNYAGNT
jgi:hypothetical protein